MIENIGKGKKRERKARRRCRRKKQGKCGEGPKIKC